MELKDALVTEVNSGMLSYGNHNTDNGFLNEKYYMVERELKCAGYEPVGVCFNVPFNPHPTKQIAFAYLVDDEVHWCHMPQSCWYNYLYDCYGTKVAEEMLSEYTKRC